MKVALISPYGEKDYFQNSIIKRVKPLLRGIVDFMVDDGEYIPSLALITLAGLFPEETEFLYIDEDYEDFRETIPKLISFKPNLSLVTAISHQSKRAEEILSALKKNNLYTLYGGMYPTSMIEESLKICDTLITGEAETVFDDFLNDFLEGKAKKIYRGTHLLNLDKSPLPRFDILPNVEIYNKFPIFTTRGCPHNCEYCGIVPIYGHKFRKKSISRVIEEIKIIKKIKKRAYIIFSDENMFVDREYSKKLLKELKKEKIIFECYTDISIGNDLNFLKLLKEAGCIEVAIGLESIIPESLELESKFKSRNLKFYEKNIINIQKNGIRVFGLFIIGLDGDYPDVFDRVFDFCQKTGIINAEFASLSPIPGTPIYERLKKENRLIPLEGQEFRWEKHEYIPQNMSCDELKKGMMKLYARFHSRENRKLRIKRIKDILSSR